MEAIRRVASRPLDVRTTCFGLAILFLNMLDAFATLRHLSHGAEELNPLLLALIRHGALSFLVIKHLLASAGVIGIVMFPEQRAAQVALAILFPVYALLAIYQIGLFYLF
jgi:hypothetical protein